MKDMRQVDLLVIGGGINGVGIARDAAGRGLSVLLCEKGDLAEGTSSRSGKLIHGGLRYLEYYEFRLVREALIEREILLRAAPHIIWPMRFVLPHSPEQRPAWLIRLGLFLYDHLGGREQLPASRRLDLRRSPEGAILQDRFSQAFEYSDCWVDDARLVVLNALDAKRHGATILTRTEAVSARRVDGQWHTVLRQADGQLADVRARVLVNAAGPWVENVINGVAGVNSPSKVRLVKGSHIITHKFWDGPQAYIFQNTDKRLIFVNPYQGDKALIGTTDIPYQGRAEDVRIEADEEDYLLSAVNRYVRKALTKDDIVHRYAGVRPLYDDNTENPSAVTRDYVLEVEGTPPMLSVFGGKITTYRKLAEHALRKLAPVLPGLKADWTAAAVLPGGVLGGRAFESFAADFSASHPWLPRPVALHYARLYGSDAKTLLNGARTLAGLGRHFGGMLYEAELRHLVDTEWARTADDVLFRRTKHGIRLTEAEQLNVRAWFGDGGHLTSAGAA